MAEADYDLVIRGGTIADGSGGDLIEGDIAKARLVLERDAEIDALNRKNYEELFGKAGDSTKVSASHVELIFISKALEWGAEAGIDNIAFSGLNNEY